MTLRNAFAADLNACIALRDARARENAIARERACADSDLVAVLLEDAQHGGHGEIDWPEYFRNVGINYP